MPRGIYIHKRLSEEHKKNLSIAHMKETVKYSAIHKWVKRIKGKASKCSFDPTHTSKRFMWANISNSYLRNIEDWIELCVQCHTEYDGIRKGYTKKNRHGIVSLWNNKEKLLKAGYIK